MMRTFADAWAVAMPDPDENGWHIAARAAVLAEFNGGALSIRVAWRHADDEVWITYVPPP